MFLDNATDKQLEIIYQRVYPEAKNTKKFVTAVREACFEISMAKIQNILMRAYFLKEDPFNVLQRRNQFSIK